MCLNDMAKYGDAVTDRATRRAASPTNGVNPGWMTAMARARGVAAQAPGVGTTEFPKSRVSPARLENLKRARAARKVSYSLLVDELLARAIYDERGQLVGLRPADSQQELPLKTA